MLQCYYGLRFQILVFLLSRVICSEMKLQFYFSDIALQMPKDSNRISFRSNDPSQIVPHLLQDDQVTIEFKTNSKTNFSIDSVTFANDGASDQITVTLDGEKLGSFNTHSYSNWGKYWNTFYNSSRIGNWTVVPPGDHTISLHVTASGDCYGVELGTLYASIDVHVEDKFWTRSSYRLADKKQECREGASHSDVNQTETDLTRNVSHIYSSTTMADSLILDKMISQPTSQFR